MIRQRRGVRSPGAAAVAAALVTTPVMLQGTALPAAAQAVSGTVLAPVADAYVDAGSPDVNAGRVRSVYVDAQPVREAYLKIVNPRPENAATASLSLTVRSADSDGFTVREARSSGWTEDGITFNNAPGARDAVCGESGPAARGQRVTVVLDTSVCPVPSGATTFVLSSSSPRRSALGSRQSPTPPSVTLTFPDGTTGTPKPPPNPKPPQTPPNQVTKVLVFVEENHSLAEMQAKMPYTFSLAQKYGYARNYSAITHPSLPNYIAIASGGTHGIADDNSPSRHPLGGSSVFGETVAAGKTAKVYAEGMTANCQADSSGGYAVKHNPWAYFTGESAVCGRFDVPETQLASDAAAGALPNVGMVVPNLCDDAHDCSLGTADSWFQTRMQDIFAGPDWKSGHLAVVLTADEDDRSQGNKVLTVVIHPSQRGNVVSTQLSHYSLTRLYEEVAGTAYLGSAAGAPSMAQAFGLPLP